MSYIKIPEQIECSDFLCPMSKLLFGRIYALAQKEGYCWATNQYLAEWYKCSQSQVTRWVSELTRAGFIECEIIKKTNTRRISILPKSLSENADTYQQNCGDVSAKTLGRISKNADTCQQKAQDSNKIKEEDNKNIEEDKSSSMSDDFFLKEKDFSVFDLECEKRGLLLIKKRITQKKQKDGESAPRAARFSEQEMQKKIAHWGETYFWEMIACVDAYLAKNKTRRYDCLSGVLTAWFGSKQEFAVQCGINAMWNKKYSLDYKSITDWSKPEGVAIKSIAKKLVTVLAKQNSINEADVSDDDFQQAAIHFFDNLPEKWATTKWFNLDNIAKEFSQIVQEIKSGITQPNIQSQSSTRESFYERDERLKREKEDMINKSIREHSDRTAKRDLIIYCLDNNKPVTDEMKSWQEYKDMFSGNAF
jgi:hypothetical protein